MFSGIITLTTDLGVKNYYVPALKGRLLGIDRKVNIVDISHEVPNFDSFRGAFLLNQSFRYFPEYTLHFLLVSNINKANSQFIIAYFDNHYFAGFDDGSFTKIFHSAPSRIHKLDLKFSDYGNSFSSMDAVYTVFKLLNETSFREFPGIKHSDIKRREAPGGYPNEDYYVGVIVDIDKFENIITDIHREQFLNYQKGRSFSILVKQHSINKLSFTYDDNISGDIIALFNAQGFLEIAMVKGSAASMLNLKINDNIKVFFN